MDEKKTLESQLLRKCIHFAGIGITACRAGVKYSEVMDMTQPPFQNIPCFQESKLPCGKREFLTAEQAAARAKEMTTSGIQGMELFMAAKVAYAESKKPTGEFTCPICKQPTGVYIRSSHNGHFIVGCKTCNLQFQQ